MYYELLNSIYKYYNHYRSRPPRPRTSSCRSTAGCRSCPQSRSGWTWILGKKRLVIIGYHFLEDFLFFQKLVYDCPCCLLLLSQFTIKLCHFRVWSKFALFCRLKSHVYQNMIIHNILCISSSTFIFLHISVLDTWDEEEIVLTKDSVAAWNMKLIFGGTIPSLFEARYS